MAFTPYRTIRQIQRMQRAATGIRRFATPQRFDPDLRKVTAGIRGVASYVPDRIVTSAEIEATIRKNSPGFDFEEGIIERLTGITARHHKADHENASDLAVAAAKKAISQAGISTDDIDMVIFASSSQDLVEPATAHIVNHKLGTPRALCMDVKNACNSFINGMNVANTMIRDKQVKTVLVCTGECPSLAIKWDPKDHTEFMEVFAGYTLGDAGAAIILEARSDGSGIEHVESRTNSDAWEVCTLRAGGTMHPRDLEHTYFRGDGVALKNAFLKIGPGILINVLKKTRTLFDDYDVILNHQVSGPLNERFMQETKVTSDKLVMTIGNHGNVASATMPLQLDHAFRSGKVKPGSRVLMIGLGAGISISIMTLTL